MRFRDALIRAEEEAAKETIEQKNVHTEVSESGHKGLSAASVKGEIASEHDFFWRREELKLVRVKNDRAFFRLETNLKALVIPMERFGAGEIQARVLNISAGGMGIWTEFQCCKGDKILLKVKLVPGEEEWKLFCEVVRIEEKGVAGFVYGCRWIELGEEEQGKLMESIAKLEEYMKG